MSDPKAPGNDPSMDDILASIRKIISDDEARSQGRGSPAAAQLPPRLNTLSASEPEPASPTPEATADHQDVLLLTDLIEDDQQVVPVPVAPPRPAPSTTFNQPLTPPSQLRPAGSEHSGAPPLAEADAADAAIATLRQLNNAVRDNAPVNAATPGPALGGGSDKTIEDMVKEMLRPMLKNWLDHNLPPMVQAIVEREISRLTRR